MIRSRRAYLVGLVAASLLGCGRGEPQPADGADSGPEDSALVGGAVSAVIDRLGSAVDRQDSLDAANPYHELDDPCILVTSEEVERVVGPLRAPPWRSGETCHYSAADGQRLDVDVLYSGALAAHEVIGVATDAMTKGLVVETARGVDTLPGRWDDAHWQFAEYLEVRKGDVGVTVHLGNTLRPSPEVAAGIADLALGRLDHPLDYRGGDHVDPGPLVTPSPACGLLTRAEVEAVVGPVVGEPEGGEDGCRWPLQPRRGRSRELSYQVTWRDGLAELNRQLAALGLTKANLIDPAMDGATDGRGERAVLDRVEADSVGRKVLGALRGMLESGGGEPTAGSLVPSTDPDVAGPWDRGAVLAGSDLLVVRKGVAVRAGLSGVGLEAARKLLGRMVSRW